MNKTMQSSTAAEIYLLTIQKPLKYMSQSDILGDAVVIYWKTNRFQLSLHQLQRLTK